MGRNYCWHLSESRADAVDAAADSPPSPEPCGHSGLHSDRPKAGRGWHFPETQLLVQGLAYDPNELTSDLREGCPSGG